MAFNRSQGLVLGFFASVWVALAAILVVAPDVYAATMRPIGVSPAVAEAGLFGCVTFLIATLVLGVMKRWRWVFWLVVLAFCAGALRVPASILELTGVLPAQGPAWYETFQALIGAVQLAIGVLLIRGYRRAGVWGEF